MVDNVEANIGADTSDFQDGMRRAARATEGLSEAMDRTGQRISTSLRNTAANIGALEGPLGGVAGRINALGTVFSRINPIIAAGTLAVSGFTAGLGLAAAAARDASVRLNTIKGVVIATGGAVGVTASEVQEMARAIGEDTLASTPALERAAATVLTFKNVTGQAFRDTLALSQDLSQAGFGNLEEVAKSLAKALNDPITGLASLAEQGVTFTERQKALVKSFAETNDIMSAQKVILDEISAQVGGTAKKAAEGLAGVVDTLGERWNRLLEQIGRIAPIKAATTLLGALSNQINLILKPLEAQQKAHESLRSIMEQFGEATGGAVIGITRYGKAIDDLSTTEALAELDKYTSKLKAVGAAAQDTSPILKLKVAIFDATNEVIRAERNFAKLEGKTGITNEVLAQFSDKSNDAKEKVKALSDQLAALLNVVEEVPAKIEESAKATDSFGPSRQDIFKAQDAYDKYTQTILDKADPAAAAFRKQSEELLVLVDLLEKGRISQDQFNKGAVEIGGVDTEEPEEDDVAKARQKAQNKAQARLDVLLESFNTEEEAIESSVMRQQSIVDTAFAAGAISEKKWSDLRTKIRKKGLEDIEKLERAQTTSQINNSASFFNSIFQISQRGSKTQFEVAKKLAIATATVAGVNATAQALASPPGPPATIPLAAKTAATAIGNVASIASTSFGGGGAAAKTPAATSAKIPSPEEIEQAEVDRSSSRGTDVTINLSDDDDDLMTNRGVRRLIERINQAVQDGVVTSVRTV